LANQVIYLRISEFDLFNAWQAIKHAATDHSAERPAENPSFTANTYASRYLQGSIELYAAGFHTRLARKLKNNAIFPEGLPNPTSISSLVLLVSQ
jgi:hypothetical protein